MMSDPLTQRRVAGFSSLMDLLTLPFSAMVPLPKGEADVATAARQCVGLLFYLQLIVSIMLPVYILVRSMPQSSLPRPPPPLPAAAGSWAQLQHSVQRAYAAANLSVWRTFRVPQSGALPSSLVFWLVVALSWTLALALHGL
jgi:hypothetical protein